MSMTENGLRELLEERSAFVVRSVRSEDVHARIQRQRKRRFALASVTVLTLAVITVAAVAGDLGASRRGGLGPPVPGASREATVLLERLASAAESRPAPHPRPDQYAYVETVSTGGEWDCAARVPARHETPPPGKCSAPGAGVRRQLWVSVDGRRPDLLVDPILAKTPRRVPPSRPASYAYLTSLPTDPRALLTKIYAGTEGQGGSRGQAAFVRIGGLLREPLAPSALSAALYRAAAQIPGVLRVDDVVDAAGRHGVGIARVDEASGQRSEWIFDRISLNYLGERDVLALPGADAGTVIQSTAVLARGVVDRAGHAPRQSATG